MDFASIDTIRFGITVERIDNSLITAVTGCSNLIRSIY